MGFIMLFTGTVKENGDSWCGDCVIAKGSYNDVQENTSVKTFIKCSVTRDEWIGKPDQPYRQHNVMQAPGVPCMILCQGSQVMMRADNLDDFANEDLMNEFKTAE